MLFRQLGLINWADIRPLLLLPVCTVRVDDIDGTRGSSKQKDGGERHMFTCSVPNWRGERRNSGQTVSPNSLNRFMGQVSSVYCAFTSTTSDKLDTGNQLGSPSCLGGCCCDDHQRHQCDGCICPASPPTCLSPCPNTHSNRVLSVPVSGAIRQDVPVALTPPPSPQ